MIPTPSLRQLTRPDLDRAIEVESLAFQEDPLWRYLIANPARRLEAARRFQRPFFRVALERGRLFGVGDPLAGVAIWSKPGEADAGFAVLARAGFLRTLLSPLAPAFFRAGPIFGQFGRMQRQYAPQPHYYLNTIAILPEAQGQGLASYLIRPFLARADREHVAAYTETMTPSNVPLYEHYGFRCQEEYRVPNTTLSIWSFYRPPADEPHREGVA